MRKAAEQGREKGTEKETEKKTEKKSGVLAGLHAESTLFSVIQNSPAGVSGLVKAGVHKIKEK